MSTPAKLAANRRKALHPTGPTVDGEDLPLTGHVLGDELGGLVKSRKRAWQTCVLKAHGHTPTWVKGRPGRLAPESLPALRQIDLHFHDLRHEAGSRLLEAGWSIHHVKEMLGHADSTTTDTFLNVTRHGLQESMQRLAARPGCLPLLTC